MSNECALFQLPVQEMQRNTDKSSTNSSSDETSTDSNDKKKKRFWKERESEHEQKARCPFLRQKPKPFHKRNAKVHKRRRPYTIGHDAISVALALSTTIELRNVPVEINKIPEIFRLFSRFGEIILIQTNRDNESNALLSYKTKSEASRAMQQSSSVIPNVEVSWYVDYCLLRSFPKRRGSARTNDADNAKSCFMENGDRIEAGRVSGKLNDDVEFFDNNSECGNRDDFENGDNLDDLISGLIKLKTELLSNQLKSREQIRKKLSKCVAGSEEQQLLLNLLHKVREQVRESERSIQYSIKQKIDYYANLNYSQIFRTRSDNCRTPHAHRPWMQPLARWKRSKDADDSCCSVAERVVESDCEKMCVVEEEQSYFSPWSCENNAIVGSSNNSSSSDDEELIGISVDEFGE